MGVDPVAMAPEIPLQFLQRVEHSAGQSWIGAALQGLLARAAHHRFGKDGRAGVVFVGRDDMPVGNVSALQRLTAAALVAPEDFQRFRADGPLAAGVEQGVVAAAGQKQKTLKTLDGIGWLGGSRWGRCGAGSGAVLMHWALTAEDCGTLRIGVEAAVGGDCTSSPFHPAVGGVHHEFQRACGYGCG